MSFIERIKQQLSDPRSNRDRYRSVPVNKNDLNELIHHFESLDSRMRSDDYVCKDLQERLRDVIIAIYKDHHDSERLMMWIMAVMTPLIEERLKQEEYNRRLHHHDSSKRERSLYPYKR